MNTWWQPLLALLTGGLVWEGFKFFYPSIEQRIKSYSEAKKNFYSSLDPILKAADELYGKIYSLSKEDFATFINPTHAYSSDVEHSKKYIIYLFAQFWAQLEFVRLKSQYSSLTQFDKGKKLLKFIEAIESRNYRILDRSIQRVIGETLIEGATNSFRVMNLNQFLRNSEIADSEINNWTKKVEEKLNECSDKKLRQRILVFGIIVAALIDCFDPKGKLVPKRYIYISKLNKTSKNIIKRDLFGYYLEFVKNKDRYFK